MSIKTKLVDINDTQKHINIEIPSDIVDAEIDRVTKGYSKTAQLSGFRPGKAPAKVIKEKFKEQILKETARNLVGPAIDKALHDNKIEPVDEPEIKDFSIDEGKPVKFTAAFEILPPFDLGDLSTITVNQSTPTVSTEAIDQALQRLQDQATRYEPIEKRPIVDGDTIVLDIEQRNKSGQSESRNDVSVAIGSEGNPPGFDANLIGLTPGDNKTFVIRFPDDYVSKELANTEITYSVVVKELRAKVVPELNDEFAKQFGNFQTIDSLRERVETDLKVEAEMTSKRQIRNDLVKQLAERIPFELPTVLVNREVDRRVEEFARQLSDQKIDPRQANIDWAQFKNNQQESARASVSGAIILDELARRESLVVEANDIDQEIKRIASRLERTPASVRAQLEKDGGIGNLELGLRREKAVELALAKAKIITT